ncbi:hypothetical protein [Microbacterium sp.]|uniref:hypothetical protein n=1 Tax=Microbacterium sp. TaxID=51671 RepID=UPI0039E30232
MSDPQHPSAQPYGTPPQPTPGSPAPWAAPAPAPTNPLGRTASIVATVVVGLALLSQLIFPLLIMSRAYDVADTVSLGFGVIVLLGSIVAVVLSILALQRPAPHLLAAIALGAAGSSLVGSLFRFALTLWPF